MTTRPHEVAISASILAAVGDQPYGQFLVDADDGSIGATGSIESGWPARTVIGVHNLPDGFLDLLRKSFDASKEQSQGPWYHCKIHVHHDRAVSYQYSWQGAPYSSLSDIQRNSRGGFPSFILRSRFDKELISQLDDIDASTAILFYVPASIKRGIFVPQTLLDLYATIDWQGDSNNGSLNQYFSRDRDPYGGLDRAELYPATLRGLESIGHTEAAKLFREALSVYSHFYERVDLARTQIGIPSIQSSDDSDVLNNYWSVEKALDKLRADYVRSHIEQLTGS